MLLMQNMQAIIENIYQTVRDYGRFFVIKTKSGQKRKIGFAVVI